MYSLNQPVVSKGDKHKTIVPASNGCEQALGLCRGGLTLLPAAFFRHNPKFASIDKKMLPLYTKDIHVINTLYS